VISPALFQLAMQDRRAGHPALSVGRTAAIWWSVILLTTMWVFPVPARSSASSKHAPASPAA